MGGLVQIFPDAKFQQADVRNIFSFGNTYTVAKIRMPSGV
jgi:hypothetical protein